METTSQEKNQGLHPRAQAIYDGQDQDPLPGTSGVADLGDGAAKATADEILLQAERFRANIASPKGNEQVGNFVNGVVCPPIYPAGDEGDDDFFHVTCHIDGNLKEKIERGEFVDLERLLPKDRNSFIGEDKRMELVSKDGMTYFSPVQDRGSRISSIRKWEQAFRVYAAIFSKAQPHRASEIWQYVYVINLAANSYQWQNVSFYDVTFHHLMSQKPRRSWVKTYVQGWNLTMTDPLGKGTNIQNHQRFSPSNKQGFQHKGDGKNKSWRDYCCWRFNKNKCKNGNECDWEHRCTYCGAWGHGYFNCRKRLGKTGTSGSGSGGNNSSNNNPNHNK